jgi:hypothetical protein
MTREGQKSFLAARVCPLAWGLHQPVNRARLEGDWIAGEGYQPYGRYGEKVASEHDTHKLPFASGEGEGGSETGTPKIEPTLKM